MQDYGCWWLCTSRRYRYRLDWRVYRWLARELAHPRCKLWSYWKHHRCYHRSLSLHLALAFGDTRKNTLIPVKNEERELPYRQNTEVLSLSDNKTGSPAGFVKRACRQSDRYVHICGRSSSSITQNISTIPKSRKLTESLILTAIPTTSSTSRRTNNPLSKRVYAF